MRAITGVASTDVITVATEVKLVDGEEVVFDHLVGGAGLSENTVYYTRDVSGKAFKVAATAGGDAVDVTSDITAGFVYRPRPSWARSIGASE